MIRFLIGICLLAQAWAVDLTLNSSSAILVDVPSGRTLYAKNPEEVRYPASTTKIMTALLVLESGPLNKMVTIQPVDTQVEPSKVPLHVGEVISREQLLYALLLKSANDAACALARDVAGSVPDFANLMNERAAQLGAVRSHFCNPHGLPDPNHYTTVEDMSMIAMAALKYPAFREIVQTPVMEWNLSGARFEMRNHNKMLFYYPGMEGIKTGWTASAKHTFVGLARRGAAEMLTVCFGADHQEIWKDTHNLLEYGFQQAGAGQAPYPPLINEMILRDDSVEMEESGVEPPATSTQQQNTHDPANGTMGENSKPAN